VAYLFATLIDTLVQFVILVVILLVLLFFANVVLFLFKPRWFSVLKAIETPILKAEWKFLRRFWKPITIVIFTAVCSILLVDILLPDYYEQFFNIRALYALLAFGLMNATVASWYKFKTDFTWFIRIALASGITFSAALFFYNYTYPTYTLILPPFNHQIQTLTLISGASLTATVTVAIAIWFINWRKNILYSELMRSGYLENAEFAQTDHIKQWNDYEENDSVITEEDLEMLLGKPQRSTGSVTHFKTEKLLQRGSRYGHFHGDKNTIYTQRGEENEPFPLEFAYWLCVTDVPESYQNRDTFEETNPHSFESGRMVSALAQSGIHFGMLVKFYKGKGEIYYCTQGKRQLDTLGSVLSTFNPGLTYKKGRVRLRRVEEVAVVEVREGYPHLQNVSEHILEYFAQKEINGVVYAVVKPYNFLGRYLSKRSKKGRYREIRDKEEHYFDPQVEIEAARKGYAVIRGDVRGGLYAAVIAKSKSEAEYHAHNIASLIRGAFTRDSKVKVITGGGAKRRLERMFTLSQSANLDLTFSEAEALVHVPRIQVGGNRITKTVQFSQTLPDIHTSNGIFLGHLVRNGVVLYDRPIVLPTGLLCKHFVITGGSGSGKTIAAMIILSELGLFGISRFVIEYRKREYRRMFLIEDEEKKPLVFPIGEQSCRFRYNPLYVYPHETVAQKISDLTWILNKLFVLYAPMDTVLEIALDLTYEEKGWRWKGEEEIRGETPTLLDLCESIEVAMEVLDYYEEAKKNIREGLLARLSTLCTGSMGSMFLCRENTPFELLRDRLVVFELDGVGEKDKPFYAFLCLYYLYQNIKEQPPSSSLEGVILVEEAHNIFEKRVYNPDSDSRASELAREFLEDLFRTMRAQGWGLGVSDQNPSNLPEEVLQNCSIQIAGRQVNADDRECIAKNMGLTEEQRDALQDLRMGELACKIDELQTVLYRGRNLESEFPMLKPQMRRQTQGAVDTLVRKHMNGWYRENSFSSSTQSSILTKLEFYQRMERVRELIRRIKMQVRNERFARDYLTIIEYYPEKLSEYLMEVSRELAAESGVRKERVYYYLKCMAKGKYGETI